MASWDEREELFFLTLSSPKTGARRKPCGCTSFLPTSPENAPLTVEQFEERKAKVSGLPQSRKRVQGAPPGAPLAPCPSLPHPSPAAAKRALAAAAVGVHHQVGLSQKEMDALSRIIKEATGLLTKWQSHWVKAHEQTLPGFDRSQSNAMPHAPARPFGLPNKFQISM